MLARFLNRARSLTFRGKLLLSIIPVLVLGVGLLTFVSYKLAARAILQEQEESMREAVEKTKTELSNWIEDRERDAALFSKNTLFQAAIRGERQEEARAALLEFHKLSPFYENLFLADKNGRLFMDSIGGKSVGVDIGKIPGFAINLEKARKNEIWVGDVMPSPATGRPVALITAPVLLNGELAGLVGTPIELNYFSQLFVNQVKFGKTGYVAILDPNGLALAHPNQNHILKTNFKQFPWAKFLYERDAGSLKYTFENVEKTGQFSLYKKKGWVIFGVVPIAELYQPLNVIKLSSSVVGVLAIAFVSLIIWAVSLQIFKVVARVTSSLSNGADRVTRAAAEIAEASAKVSSSATEQAAALQETVSSAEQVNAMVGKNADAARQSSSVSAESSKTAERGKLVVNEMIRSIHDIDESNTAMVKQIEDGNQRISEIIKVIVEIGNKTKVINDIVFQTKLLSFNASVEAARAGENGKGFAVVAEEVGNLAQMSGSAAEEISSLLQASIQKVEQIITETKQNLERHTAIGKERVATGTETARRCQAVLDEVVRDVERVTQFAGEIATASAEQAAGVQEITKAMTQLEQVTQHNTSAAEQTSASAQELTGQAAELHVTVQSLLSTIYGTSEKAGSGA